MKTICSVMAKGNPAYTVEFPQATNCQADCCQITPHFRQISLRITPTTKPVTTVGVSRKIHNYGGPKVENECLGRRSVHGRGHVVRTFGNGSAQRSGSPSQSANEEASETELQPARESQAGQVF